MTKRSRGEAALNRAAAVKAAKDEKLAAIRSACEMHGKEIAARILIADKALAELKEKSGAALKTFVDHRHAIAKMLADAKDACKAAKMSFEEFRLKYAPNFQRSLTYELVAIGQGKLTLEDRTAAATKRKQKSRADARVLSAAVEAAKARETPAAPPAEPVAEPVGQATHIEPVAEPVVEPEAVTVDEPGIPEPPAEPVVAKEKLEECLDRMMAEARELKSVVPAHTVCVRCITYLAPFMNEATRAQLRKEISAITNRADTMSRKAA